jgi:hypothetical protein
MPMRGTSRFGSDTREPFGGRDRPDRQMDRGKGRDDARGRERDRYNERETESQTDNLPDVAMFSTVLCGTFQKPAVVLSCFFVFVNPLYFKKMYLLNTCAIEIVDWPGFSATFFCNEHSRRGRKE